MSTANIGLVWFMFFSGYGLSLKHMEKGEIMGKWWNRFKKVYLPLLFTSFISIGVYALLPMKFNVTMSKKLWLVDEIAAIHQGNFMGWFPSAFGWLDWYVFCIMIFYTLFYLSYFFNEENRVEPNPCVVVYDGYNPETRFSNSYDLDVEVENNEVVQIEFPNGGYLTASEKVNSDGTYTVTDDRGCTYDVQIEE